MRLEKPKNYLPRLEDLKVDQLYTLTLNPSEQHSKRRMDREAYVIADMVKLFRRDKTTQGHLYMELSPHGRVHFHGVIAVLDRYNFYLNLVPLLEENYTIEIDTIKDESVWHDYCTKQSSYLPEAYRKGWSLNYKEPTEYLPNTIPKCFQAQD